MTRAYVLITTEPGKTEAVQQALQGKPGIRSADMIIGPYDIIAAVEAADLNAVGQLVLGEIRGVSGVTNTLTCAVVERTSS
jgi:DNA-binding Lrp family transcriptional regulator